MSTRVFLVLILAVFYASSTCAQLQLPNPFRRSRLGRFNTAQQEPAKQPPVASATTVEQPPAYAAPSSGVDKNSSSSSSSGGSHAIGGKCGAGWGLAAIGADAHNNLPASTDRVLICLISSGVHKDAAAISHNRWTGCVAQDPLDPTGCILPWATSPAAPGFKPRGTWAAGIMAAKGAGVIPAGTDIHVVPVDGPASGAIHPNSLAMYGKSRLRAYTVCEGRLRGLQAADYSSGSSSRRWRMVMLVDVISDKPASIGTGEYKLSEGEWVEAATGPGKAEAAHKSDVLVIAPAGQKESVGYPAALSNVVGVGGFKCDGAMMQRYSEPSSKPDILAPGANVAAAATDAPWTDTTAAAAFVAGAAARLWSAVPGCSANQIRQALLSSSENAVRGEPPRLNLPAATAAVTKLGCA